MAVVLAISESIPQRELDQPRRADGGVDFAEWRRGLRQSAVGRTISYPGSAAKCRFHVVETRISEVGMIPDVKEIRRESKILFLGDAEVLDEREVPVLLEWSAIQIPAKISESCHAGTRICALERERSC